MFTGITQEILTVVALARQPNLLQMQLSVPKQQYGLGDSIMLNGVCSTVTEVTSNQLTVEFMEETLQLTTVGEWQVGNTINAEAPATLASKLSGSLVIGHVDAVGKVKRVEAGQDYAITVEYDKSFSGFVIHKGSITLDGVNLTVVAEGPGWATVKLIPFTRNHTTLGALTAGKDLNIEFDYIAKIIVHSQNSEAQK